VRPPTPLVTLLLIGLGTLGTAAAAPPDPGAPGLATHERLAALVQRVKYEQEQLRTLEADFVQRRVSVLLVEPEVSQGSFAFAAPDRVRWDYRSPRPLSLVVAGKQMTTWYRDLGSAERLDVSRYSTQILRYLGAGGSLDSLLQYFTVRARLPAGGERPYRLDLEPRYPRIAKRLAGVTVWIDPRSFLPVRLEYREPDGDSTEYEFSNVRVNPPLDADRFELEMPSDVQVRSVGAAQPGQP
jgi:outer membrane lipoprotein-sorting protein